MRSTFNGVERRKAPLSHDLAGVVLPLNSFRNHLNSQNETINEELQMKNFTKVGEILAEIWNRTVIDGSATVAEYIHPETDEAPVIEQDQEWWGKHVRESQYLLQIAKFDDPLCCKPRKSSLFPILTEGFLPPPLPISQGKHALEYGENVCRNTFLSVFSNLAMNKKTFYLNILPESFRNVSLMISPVQQYNCNIQLLLKSLNTSVKCSLIFMSV